MTSVPLVMPRDIEAELVQYVMGLIRSIDVLSGFSVGTRISEGEHVANRIVVSGIGNRGNDFITQWHTIEFSVFGDGDALKRNTVARTLLAHVQRDFRVLTVAGIGSLPDKFSAGVEFTQFIVEVISRGI